MNQSELYTQWLSALRSGEYEQGRGSLKEGNRFCCLGVACDVLSNNGEGEWRTGQGDWNLGEDVHVGYFHINGQKDSGVLPYRVQEYLGMDAAGRFDLAEENHFDEESDRYFNYRSALTELNDDGFTFTQIADVIEYFFAPKSL